MPSIRFAIVIGTVSVLAWTAAPRAAGEIASSPKAGSGFDACEPAGGKPWTQYELMCLYQAGMRAGQLAEARSRLRSLGAGRVDHPWPTLVLGYATQRDDERTALELYQTAASGFASRRDADGEVTARHNLRNIYHRQGNTEAAAREVTAARAAAEASGDPLPKARAAVLEASHAMQTGGDLGRAYRTLQRADHFAFPDGPIGLRRTILLNLANASLLLGRLDDTVDALERHRRLREEDGSTTDAAAVTVNLLNARLTKAEEHPTRRAREQLLAEATDVLAEVERLGRPALVAQTHRVLADLLRSVDPDAAATHVRRCLEIERPLLHAELRASCLWTQSLIESRRDPQNAEKASREAIETLTKNPEGPLLAYAWQARLQLAWHTMSEDEAIPASLQALEAIERLRRRQDDEGSRASLFSQWTRDYYRLTGRLLETSPPRLAQAFAVGERLRARGLLDQIGRDRSRAGETGDVEGERRREGLQQQVVETQRRILAPALSERERGALLDELRLLELEQHDARGSRGDRGESSFGSLEQVQQSLEPDEALLWYSIAPRVDVYGDFAGGAWLLVVRHDTVALHPLSIDMEFSSQVAAFSGLISNREALNPDWEPAAVAMGQTLVRSGLASLAPGVTRLIIVTDGELHRLPFEALRPDAGQPRLGQRFDLTLVPSATLWLRLRNQPVQPASRAALILADPVVSPGSPDGDISLAPLRWARHEAQRIAATLPYHAHEILEGEDASEHSLKQAALGDYAILHLAAHSRADRAYPDRSAVFLTPGDAGEDGWLQPREIAALDMTGQLVVLSACESGSGFALSGEGPLSLARAFFAGGAGAVVATRWPLRDDDAAFVMERFYRALGSGIGAAGALRQARLDAMADGRPASVWAGVVLIGDGLKNPLPPRQWPAASWGLAAVALLASGWWIFRGSRL